MSREVERGLKNLTALNGRGARSEGRSDRRIAETNDRLFGFLHLFVEFIEFFLRKQKEEIRDEGQPT